MSWIWQAQGGGNGGGGPPIPLAAQPWGTVYQVDFTAQPSQSIGAGGAYVIDGRTWYAKGAKSASHSATDVVLGTGLRFTLTGPLGYLPNGDLPGGGFNTQILFCPFSQFSTYNPLSPVTVQMRCQMTTAWPAAALQSIAIGMIGAASNGSPFLAASRNSQQWCGFTNLATDMALFAGPGNYTTVGTAYNSTNLSNHTFGVVRPTQRGGIGIHAQWSGNWPDIAGTLDVEAPAMATLAPTNLGVALLLNSQTAWTGQVMQLRIAQPKIAA